MTANINLQKGDIIRFSIEKHPNFDEYKDYLTSKGLDNLAGEFVVENIRQCSQEWTADENRYWKEVSARKLGDNRAYDPNGREIRFCTDEPRLVYYLDSFAVIGKVEERT